jgi:hypothetical protein
MPKRNGTAPIDAVRRAYTQKRRKLVVPEWGNLEMYFGPLTVDDMESVNSRVKDESSAYERNVLLMIHKARDKEGSSLFNFGDKKVLEREADLLVMQRVINFIYEGVLDSDEAEEEVKGNPTSDSD